MAISIQDQYVYPLISRNDIDGLAPQIESKFNELIRHTGAGNDFLGWLDLPQKMLDDKVMWEQIRQLSEKWKNRQISHIVVIGIGGSYLGAKAVTEVLQPALTENSFPQLIFCGHHLSGLYLDNLCNFLKTVSFGIIVISKSGTTLEPAIAFRVIRQLMSDLFGEAESNNRIISVTDASKGALRKLTMQFDWPSFYIDDSVGGRYSVLSPVGIVPLYLAGINVHRILEGAYDMRTQCFSDHRIHNNPALHYAALRYLLYQSGRKTELLATFQPELQYFIEWWKQLFGESDGKENRGIFPAGVIFSTDLHSMGQYIQEGVRTIFETFIIVQNKSGMITVPDSQGNEDGLNYLTGRKVSEINHLAEKATMLAHYEGDVPVIGLSIERCDEFTLGQLIYFFEFACAIGGYLLGVNPFDQPGVEAYKQNMFALLGKPGMEVKTSEILSKLGRIND